MATRKQIADELWRRLERGPLVDDPLDGSPLKAEDVRRSYRGWARSWILEDLARLVPELRGRKVQP
jgi:hypothetical protein